MKKLKLVLTTLCLIGTLAFAVPTVAYADEGPQGTSNSAPKPPPPPPPPPDLKTIIFWIIVSVY